MSKLADRIKRAGRAEPQRIGFATTANSPAPSLLVVVSVDDAAKAKDMAGADAVVVGSPGKKQDFPGDAVWGVRGDSLDAAAVSSAREAGADFVVVNSSVAAAALLEEGIGFVLALGEAPEDTRLRLLGDLNLDAILVAGPTEPVSLDSLLELRRIAALTRMPLLARIDPAATMAMLQTLRESGVVGVVVEGAAAQSLGALRDTIAALPARGKRRENHAEALLPAQAAGGGGEDYDDDDED